MLAFLLWGGTEAAQQALTKVALDRTWRAAWPTADEAARTLIRSHVALYDVLWDAMYLLIVMAFLAGNVLLGLAMRGERGLGRWVSVAYWGAAALTLTLVLAELGAPDVPEPLSSWSARRSNRSDVFSSGSGYGARRGRVTSRRLQRPHDHPDGKDVGPYAPRKAGCIRRPMHSRQLHCSRDKSGGVHLRAASVPAGTLG